MWLKKKKFLHRYYVQLNFTLFFGNRRAIGYEDEKTDRMPPIKLLAYNLPLQISHNFAVEYGVAYDLREKYSV